MWLLGSSLENGKRIMEGSMIICNIYTVRQIRKQSQLELQLLRCQTLEQTIVRLDEHFDLTHFLCKSSVSMDVLTENPVSSMFVWSLWRSLGPNRHGPATLRASRQPKQFPGCGRKPRRDTQFSSS